MGEVVSETGLDDKDVPSSECANCSQATGAIGLGRDRSIMSTGGSAAVLFRLPSVIFRRVNAFALSRVAFIFAVLLPYGPAESSEISERQRGLARVSWSHDLCRARLMARLFPVPAGDRRQDCCMRSSRSGLRLAWLPVLVVVAGTRDT